MVDSASRSVQKKLAAPAAWSVFLLLLGTGCPGESQDAGPNPATKDAGPDANDGGIAETPGVTLSLPVDLAMDEDGEALLVTVGLDSPPEAEVTLDLSVSDVGEISVSPQQIVISPGDWSGPREILIQAADDDVDDGTVAVSVHISLAASADPGYSALDDLAFVVDVYDDDEAGIVATPGAIGVDEGGSSTTISVRLASAPLEPVTVPLEDTSGLGRLSYSPLSLVFGPNDWDVAQDVIVSAVDDNTAQGALSVALAMGPATEGDAAYKALAPVLVAVTINDDDDAAFSLSVDNDTVTEGGGGATLSVTLGAAPVADVVVPLSADILDAIDVVPAALTFSPDNWDVPQSALVLATDDNRVEALETVELRVGALQTTDPEFSALSAQTLVFSVVDNDTAGAAVGGIDGLTGEDGTSAAFTVALTAEPAAAVTVPVVSTNPAEGVASPATLSFDASTWAMPQTVTVVGVDDAITDGDADYAVALGPMESVDTDFDGVVIDSVSVTNIDDETPGITVGPPVGTVSESGTSATFAVRLNTAPSSPVLFNLSSSNTDEATVTPAQMVFTAANYNVIQTITMTGVDDPVTDGDQPVSVTFTPTVSGDPDYHNIQLADVVVNNADNDIPGVLVSALSGPTTEGGGTATFTMRLLAQPTDNVTFVLTCMDTGEASLSPSAVTFGPGNFDDDQTITVTGVDDDLVDGTQTYVIVILPATSNDAAYSGLDPDNLTNTNEDDDVAAIVVTPANLTALEGGPDGEINVTLSAAPNSTVTLPVAVDTPTPELSLAVSELTFTSADWDQPHALFIIATDDDIDDADVTVDVTFGPTTGADANFVGLTAPSVAVTGANNDVAGVTIAPTVGVETSEAGAQATISVVLDSEPTSDVTLPLTTADTAEISLGATLLVFTAADWNIAQSVTITGVDDATKDGDEPFTVTFLGAASGDPKYSGLDPDDVLGTNIEPPWAVGLSGGADYSCTRWSDDTVTCRGDNRLGQAALHVEDVAVAAPGGTHACAVDNTNALACWGDNSSGQATAPAGSFIDVGAGVSHTCAVEVGGSVTCFGRNDFGQSTAPALTAQRVDAGERHSCALKADDTLSCWGSNADGRATPPAGTFVSFAVGRTHACAIATDDSLVCWGENDFGEASAPSGVFVDVVAGDYFSCARRVDDTVTCWGSNADGRASAPGGTFIALGGGAAHACAIDANDALTCWGRNAFGQQPAAVVSATLSEAGAALCDATTCYGPVSPRGQLAAPVQNAVGVAVGRHHACATGDTTRCWGEDDAGARELVAGATAIDADDNVTCAIVAGEIACAGGEGPLAVGAPPAGTFSDVAVSAQHACALDTVGTVTCWGDDGDGQATAPGGTFVAITVGEEHSCALDGSGVATCWGNDDAGQSSAPLVNFDAIAAGATHTCAIRSSDGTLLCWGEDGDGQATPPGGSFVDLGAGADHTCAIATDDSLTCWGVDLYGQASAPAGAYSFIAGGTRSSCAVNTLGDVLCWGEKASGAAAPPAGPVQGVALADTFGCVLGPAGALTCWGSDASGRATPPPGSYDALALGKDFGCAAASSDGALSCWGSNSFGQTAPPSVNAEAVVAGLYFGCAREANDALVCFGADDAGQVSDAPSTAVQVALGERFGCARDGADALACWGEDNDGEATAPGGAFADVAAGANHACALDAAGVLTCWGSNAMGQTDVPDGVFVDVLAGGDYSCARDAAAGVTCWGAMQF